jgi:hypothetical protein
MMDKSTRLTVRLSADARAWLVAEADKRGLDEAAFARMLIYERMNGAAPEPLYGTSPIMAELPGIRADNAARRKELRQREAGQTTSDADAERIEAGLEEQLADEPRAEELEVPADADGGDPFSTFDGLMQAGPSFLDELIERQRPREPAAAPAPRRPGRSLETYDAPQAPRAAPRYRRSQGLQPTYGPGSQTRVVGVNPEVGRGNMFGDGYGNVLRDNMAHFGMVGTRSRA